MAEELRIVEVARVVLPGAMYTFPSTATPRLGTRLFVRFAGSPAGAAGIVGVVEELRRLPGGGSLVTVFGAARAVPASARGGTAAVDVVEVVDDGATDALAQATAAGRGYLGALAEFGEAADVMAPIPEDPVAGSYRLALLARITEPERQELLDIGSTTRRLERITTMFHRERRLLTAAMGRKGS